MATTALFLSTLIFAASDPDEPGTPEPRHVCALFDGGDLVPGEWDPVHNLLETPLNHLGMVVHRHDLRAGSPAEDWLTRARALILFFGAEGLGPPWLWPWLEREVIGRDIRIIFFGEFGPLVNLEGSTEPDTERLTQWMSSLGLEYDLLYEEGPLGINVKFIDPALCNYEGSPLSEAIHFGPRNVSPNNRVWVETTSIFHKGDRRAPVVTGPWGAVVLDPFAHCRGGQDEERRWYLDPFAFFREALGLSGVPAPDPAVLNGRRMFILHVDGDGFESLSTVKNGAYSAEVYKDEILDKYALPSTISVIIASLTRDLKIAEPTDRMLLAREILNHPSVEPASHTITHPLKWRRQPLPGVTPESVKWYRDLENYDYDPILEVTESIRFINERLLEPGRRCEVMLWSGDTRPSETVLRSCKTVQALNFNGGEARWDAWQDSLGFVSPWGRFVGNEFQVYCAAANENNFDGFFTTTPGAYGNIDTTIERTGTGRILEPANIYIHFYSAERPGRLRPLKRLIERWAFNEPTAPVFASQYVKAVNSAVFGAELRRLEDGWSLSDFGDCRTVRIDGETRKVDFHHSRGLLGARFMNQALFVHLSGPEAVVRLAADPKPHPHVLETDHAVSNAVITPNSVRLVSKAHSRRNVVLAGFGADREVTVHLDGHPETRRTNAAGELHLDLGGPGETLVEVIQP